MEEEHQKLFEGNGKSGLERGYSTKLCRQIVLPGGVGIVFRYGCLNGLSLCCLNGLKFEKFAPKRVGIIALNRVGRI